MKRVVAFLLTAGLCMVQAQLLTGKSSPSKKYKLSHIVVKFKDGVSQQEMKGLHGRNQSNEISRNKLGFMKVTVPSGKTVPGLVKKYRNSPLVKSATPDYLAFANLTPNDQYYSGYQWNLQDPSKGGIDMEPAWETIGGGSPDVVIAVLDVGVAYEDYIETVVSCLPNGKRCQETNYIYALAPDLAQTVFVPGYDFINDDAHPNDDEGHGTHVAGTIAQSTNNEIGVAGIAYNSSIMPVKVLDESGSGSYTQIADGIIWAVDNDAQVINMSLSGPSDAPVLEAACQYAYNAGVILVCAAGNDGAEAIGYPAAYDAYCIAVGATGYDKNRAPYSNYGSALDIVAPGGNTAEDLNGDGYGDGILQQTLEVNGTDYTAFNYYFFQGTSMATPHVAGVAGLLLSANPGMTVEEVRDALLLSATDLGSAGRDDYYGWGLLNAPAALAYSPTPNTIPEADAGGPYAALEDEDILFDGSGSYDADGDNLTYQWNFGDGTSGSGVSPAHAYIQGGIFTVTLTVHDGRDISEISQTTATITEVNDAPDAAFSTSADNLTVTFTDESDDMDGNVVDWSWDLGDGNSSTAQNPVHTYGAAGDYLVQLTVTDDMGATDTESRTISVSEAAPIVLTASGYKNRGRHAVALQWSPTAPGTDATIERDGTGGPVTITTDNDGEYTDAVGTKGAATYQYRVCNNSGSCSDVVTVVFE